MAVEIKAQQPGDLQQTKAKFTPVTSFTRHCSHRRLSLTAQQTSQPFPSYACMIKSKLSSLTTRR